MSQIGMSDLGQDAGQIQAESLGAQIAAVQGALMQAQAQGDAGAIAALQAQLAVLQSQAGGGSVSSGFLGGLKAKWAGLSNVGKAGVLAAIGGGLWYAKKKRMF